MSDQINNYPILHLKPERLKSLRTGHPWIFSGALQAGPKPPDGSLVLIGDGYKPIATGFYNGKTDIAIRVICTETKQIDYKFFAESLKRLYVEKFPFVNNLTNAWRLCFGESDGIPGLVVDIYHEVASVQFHNAGIDAFRPVIFDVLSKEFDFKCIVERSDVSARRAEGLLPIPPKIVWGKLPEFSQKQNEGELEIQENGMRFIVNVLTGQKTGFFLDQRANRAALQNYVKGKKVLNCFSYSGGFSVAAALASAQVTSTDISAAALELCKRNLELNGYQVKPEELIEADVFDWIKTVKPNTYDCILLDPPSLAKSRSQWKNAVKAYTSINSTALQKLPVGGLLISSSCTAHVDSDTFIKILHQSSVNAGCGLRLIESREQPADHGYHLSFPEARYLKFFVCQKIAKR